MTQDWSTLAQEAAESHIEAVWDYFHAAENGEEGDREDPSYGPFDGCTTCEVREILMAAAPHIIAGVLSDRQEAPG